jgi:hypothetical protein
MTNQSIHVVENHVTKTDDPNTTTRQIGYRAQELADYARAGYTLAHTVTIEVPERLIFVDTLTRDDG